MEKIYAKVNNGIVVEYPIYEKQLLARNTPKLNYYECIYTTRPTVSEFETVTTKAIFTNGKVYVNYEVKEITLEQLLTRLTKNNNATINEVVTRNISDIDPKNALQLEVKITNYAQKILDDFAKEKGYDNAAVAISYENSSITYFQSEAVKIRDIRDKLWLILYQYLDDIKQGKKNIPTSVFEIKELLPEMKW